MTQQGRGPSASPGSSSRPSLSAASAAPASGISAPGLLAAPFLCGEKSHEVNPAGRSTGTGRRCLLPAAGSSAHLGMDVTCSLMEEMGRLGRELPAMLGVDSVCSLSARHGAVGSQGTGCSAFSPERREEKGSTVVERAELEQAHSAAAQGTSLEACWAEAWPQQRTPAPFLRSGFWTLTMLRHHQSQQGHWAQRQAANRAASLPAAAGSPSLPAGPSVRVLPPGGWPAVFRISRTTSLSSWSGCKKSQTQIKAGMTQEQRIFQRKQEKRLLLLHPVLEGEADGCSSALP